jgi:hypothetical protein
MTWSRVQTGGGHGANSGCELDHKLIFRREPDHELILRREPAHELISSSELALGEI